jgi:hypothetical protein
MGSSNSTPSHHHHHHGHRGQHRPSPTARGGQRGNAIKTHKAPAGRPAHQHRPAPPRQGDHHSKAAMREHSKQALKPPRPQQARPAIKPRVAPQRGGQHQATRAIPYKQGPREFQQNGRRPPNGTQRGGLDIQRGHKRDRGGHRVSCKMT